MHTATNRNLLNFIELPSLKCLAGSQPAVGQGEFYQQITHLLVKGVYDKQLFCKLANTMIRIADHAYVLRRADIIEQASQVILNLPLPHEYRSIGLYYYAISIENHGRYTEACMLLERVAEDAPPRYRAKATQMLGSLTHMHGDFEAAWPYYVEASRIAASNGWCDPQTTITSQQNMVILNSLDGDHRRALSDLENLFPLVRAIGPSDPYRYYHFLNSYAVELGEVGRLDEAQNVCKIVLASPLAFAYPEWRETNNDISLRRYRTYSVRITAKPLESVKKNNVMALPLPSSERSTATGSVTTNPKKPARVFDMQAWKEKMGKEPNGDHKSDEIIEDIENMTNKDLLVEILQRTSDKSMSEKKLRKILEYVMQVETEPED